MQKRIRVGFTASRRVGRAVERNRARRRLKAVAEKVLPAHGKPGYDYVVIARRATLARPFAMLMADMEQAVRQVEQNQDRGTGRRHSPEQRRVR